MTKNCGYVSEPILLIIEKSQRIRGYISDLVVLNFRVCYNSYEP
jgi:hypothetical protein